jgi:hypothetical protein
MKRLLMICLLGVFALSLQAGPANKIPRYNRITKQWASYPVITVRDAQFVPSDSLRVCDSLQETPARWDAQTSHYSQTGDTVVIIGTIVCPAHFLTYTAKGWTYLLHDTSSSNLWGGILVRELTGVNGMASGYADSNAARADGFEAPVLGDVVMITGTINEFPLSTMLSTSQFQPIYGFGIDIVGHHHYIPPPTQLLATDVFIGDPSIAANVQYSKSEPYEGSLVKIDNLTINSYVKQSRGTWDMYDAAGNKIADYDASHYWTVGNESPVIPGDTSFHLPPVGAVIDSIKGTLLTVAGGKASYGYQICPLYPGDVKYGITLPGVSTHRRYPVVVTSDDTVIINATAKQLAGGYPITSVQLFKSLNYGAWQSDVMSPTDAGDTTFQDVLLDPDGNPLPNGTTVRYFIKATDNMGNSKILANSSFTAPYDTNKGLFYYQVHNGVFSIHDVQYTPYPIGRSPYLGGFLTVKGVVTADTTDLVISQKTTVSGAATISYGTSAWFIQDGNSPWNGIWVVSNTDTLIRAALANLRRGDSVVVSGYVGEYNNSNTFPFEQTRLVDSILTVVSHNRPVPAPVQLTTGRFKSTVPSGDPNAEPYEGMLVKFVNTTVASVNPTFAWPWQYSIDDGSGAIDVLQDGNNSYSNLESDTTLGKAHIFHVGDKIDTIVGVLYGSYGRWTLVPRKDDDFVAGENYKYSKGWNMVSVPQTQVPASGFASAAIFPGASSSVFNYANGYHSQTMLAPGIGYWVKFPADKSIRQLGVKRTTSTIAVNAGWNMIGSLSSPALASGVSNVQPSGNFLSNFFGYSGSYKIADTLLPAKGYWVKANQAGSFDLSSYAMLPLNGKEVLAASQCNTVTITDKNGNSQTLYVGEDATGKLRLSDYEMPPAAPEASEFDVRFASGRILEAYRTDVTTQYTFPIAINAANSPLTVEWNIVNKGDRRFVLADAENGKVMKTRELTAKGNMILAKSGSFNLNLRVSNGIAKPKEFSLSDNYPNPFNPTTSFQVALPYTANLQIAVYNLLGQKVASLVDESRDAGTYTVIWNGLTQEGPAATGIYFVRMNADKFTAVKKIMLMK